MNGYLKICEVVEKWGISEKRINTPCLEEIWKDMGYP